MKRVALVSVFFFASMSFLSCGSYHSPYYLPPSALTTRVLVSQSVASPGSAPGLYIVNGFDDTIARGGINAGSSPGLMALSSDRSTLMVLDSVTNNINAINTKTESSIGIIALPGPTTSMVVLGTGYGYAAVPTAPLIGSAPGAVIVMNVPATFTSATIGVPNAQTVVPSPDGTAILVFSADSDAVTVLSPLLVNTGVPATVTVAGFDRPVNAVFSEDGSTAYVLNCGPQCDSGTASPSVQILDMATLTLGASLAVDGATIGWLNGSTLYVAGTSPTNNLCTGQTTAAPTCGRLDIVDLGAFAVTSSVVITDGYHDRIDMSSNGQLFIGSYGCSTVGNVYNPQGEVRGCLSIFDTTTPGNTSAIIPPDNGDVTGLQSFTSRYIEYVAEGGNLRVYDTTIDKLLINDFVTTGTITIPGKLIDVKAIDFF